jgi:anti-sigma regulatory factor (Ser/Thr protein kinase)
MAFPGTPDQVAAARRWVRAVLAGHPALSDLELITGELISNAVRHTASGLPGGWFHVHLEQDGGSVLVMVCDQGSESAPSLGLCPGPDGEGGRGLMIVGALASRLWEAGGRRSRTVAAVVSTL